MRKAKTTAYPEATAHSDQLIGMKGNRKAKNLIYINGIFAKHSSA
jgi:hypothetical protein